jgi:hypothetical protein
VYRSAVRRAAVLLVTALLCACADVTSGIFTHRDVACGETALVFSNADKVDEKVVVKVTDRCIGVDSELQLLDPDGKVLERFPIPDTTTQTFHVLVKTDNWLQFVCAGREGGCSYSVSGE